MALSDSPQSIIVHSEAQTLAGQVHGPPQPLAEAPRFALEGLSFKDGNPVFYHGPEEVYTQCAFHSRALGGASGPGATQQPPWFLGLTR